MSRRKCAEESMRKRRSGSRKDMKKEQKATKQRHGLKGKLVVGVTFL